VRVAVVVGALAITVPRNGFTLVEVVENADSCPDWVVELEPDYGCLAED
jgi:hypothetical protein